MKPSLVIIGLGNPGKEYERTRHNAGFQALDVLSESFGEGEWKDAQKFVSVTQEGRIVTVPILLVKPQTYMNRCGEAARKLVDFYKFSPAKNMIVMTDDIDLPLGEVRFRQSGGAGTHNGMKSLVEQFGEDFPRIRIGIGSQPTGADLANWVLSAMTEEESKVLTDSYAQIPEMIRTFVLGNEKEDE